MLKLKRKDAIVVSFFGDGAVDEGVFYESLNFAALKSLPILFICENNFYAIHTHQLRRQKLANICERARACGILAEQISDNDVLRIYERAADAVRLLRSRETGPVFLECLTYRMKEHVGPNDDFHLGYRSMEEAEPWLMNDPVSQLARLVDALRRQEIEREVEAEIREAFAFAEQSAFPESAELYTDVYDSSDIS
jgi:TPP-dependent pyruvate/acetoin dehydrogenase alpha subunit